MKVNRVERHTIKKSHQMWNICDELCFKSKNIYNYANYTLRQEFINNGKYIKYNDLTFQLKHSEPFRDLGSNSSQHTLKMLDKSWKSFFVSIKDWSKNPSKYLGRPKIPKYKDKNGRHVTVLTNVQSKIKEDYLVFSFKPLKPFSNLVKTKIQGKHMQTRIIPKGSTYILEIVYEIEIPEQPTTSSYMIGIDLGVNNFATITNNIGIKPIAINGKGIKSYNQYWNKEMAHYRSKAKKVNDLHWTKRMERMTQKRNNKMDYFMHKASKYVIDHCIESHIDTIVIGKNDGWKQKSKMSKKVNQNFVQIPYESFISKLRYKCEDVGIRFILTEESYTSGCSFIDGELPCKESYNKSRRVHRGLFKSNNGTLINADVNGAYNIIRKVFPNAFANGIEGVDLHPIVMNM